MDTHSHTNQDILVSFIFMYTMCKYKDGFPSDSGSSQGFIPHIISQTVSLKPSPLSFLLDN